MVQAAELSRKSEGVRRGAGFMNTFLPTLLTVISTVTFFTLERVFPGRELPNSKGWYVRALLVNLIQLTITCQTFFRPNIFFGLK